MSEEVGNGVESRQIVAAGPHESKVVSASQRRSVSIGLQEVY